jgi:methylmalonyl-CoA/ethylmalonyl-CoA epimerase
MGKSVLKQFDHVGIAVRDVDDALLLYSRLGAQVVAYKKRTLRNDYTWTQFNLGGQRFELIEPVRGTRSFLTRFLSRYGEGLHHLTFQVSNIMKTADSLRSQGVRVTGEDFGDPSWRTAFLSPRSTNGVLIQLYETITGGLH